MRTALCLAVLALAAPGIAHAQATLITGLGGPLGFGTSSLPRGDDSISSQVDLTPLFPTGFDFYGRHYTSLYVNTNGNVSFGGALPTFTPTAFPLPTSSRPIIAAWWGDVDTRAPIVAEPNQNLVYYAVDTTNMRFVATWTEVGYFAQHDDRLNSFQIVLTPAADGRTFEVELRYNRCEWTTGDASGGMRGVGGTPAQAGFDAADAINFLTLAGSRTMAVLDLCVTSNVMMPGVWQLHGVVVPFCGNGIVETGEECDDGNTEDHDYCDNTCHRTTPCYTIYPDGAVHDPLARDVGAVDASVGLDGGDASNDFDGGDADLDAGDAGFDAGDAGSDGGDAGSEGGDAGLDAGDASASIDATMRDASMAVDAPLPRCMPPMLDGGRRRDAGTRFDAGPSFDGGRGDGAPRVDMLDVTGGGCGCRIFARSRRIDVYAIVFGLALFTRNRARARARAGTSRRP